MSRRALLGAVSAGSVMLGIQGLAQDVGSPIRGLAWMMPRGTTLGTGPNDFPVNGTFASLGLSTDVLTNWKLQLTATTGVKLEMTRETLLAKSQHSYSLPLACREGWTTTQLWTGVRMRDLAAAMHIEGAAEVDMVALDGGAATLAANQVAADETLLVLKVNGTALSPDHGFPARVIVPNGIAVNCLKWVTRLHFREIHHAPAPTHSTIPGMRGM
jgi:DMSO/TMAO reductase YedYZ molybdopterin-dependent catalytic subunit